MYSGMKVDPTKSSNTAMNYFLKIDYRFSFHFSRFQSGKIAEDAADTARAASEKKSVEDHGEVPESRGALVLVGLEGGEWGDRQ